MSFSDFSYLSTDLPKLSYRGLFAAAAAVLVSFVLAACGGGGGGNGGATTSPPPGTQTHVIGGTITGVTVSGLVLQNNGGDNLTVAPGATTFTFATPVATGGIYSVAFLTTPNNSTCTISQGAGAVAAADITNIAVSCTIQNVTPRGLTIGGMVSGLTATGLVLQDNGGDDLSVAAGATSFTFATPIASGAAYSVTVKSAPANTTCAVTKGSGTVTTDNVTNIAVTCAAGNAPPVTYTIGGSLTNLRGAGLVLQNNGGDDLTVSASGLLFTFATPLAAASTYAVTVLTQPPNQTCTVMNGTGAVASRNVTSIGVTCVNVGQFVYVVNATDTTGGTSGNVSQFAIDPGTGALSAIGNGRVAAHTKPIGIAIDARVPAVPVLYVANATSADVTAFDFSTVSGSGLTAGALMALGNTSIPGETPAAITIPPSGAYLFVGGGTAPRGSVYGFTLDQNGDGPLDLPMAAVASDGPTAGVAVAPSRPLVFATTSVANNLDVYSIAAAAALTPVSGGPYATGNDPRGVAVWPKGGAAGGFVYTANRGDNTISAFSYDGSGSLKPATTYPTGQAPVGITIDPTGAYLYTANSGDGTVSAFSINRSTGVLTALGAPVASGNLNPSLHSNPAPIDLELDPSGKYLYCVNATDGSVSLFTVNAGVLKLSNTYATGAGAIAVAVY